MPVPDPPLSLLPAVALPDAPPALVPLAPPVIAACAVPAAPPLPGVLVGVVVSLLERGRTHDNARQRQERGKPASFEWTMDEERWNAKAGPSLTIVADWQEGDARPPA